MPELFAIEPRTDAHHTAGLRVLLATSFSDACRRATGAVAQLAGVCGMNLTIAHVTPAATPFQPALQRLDAEPARAGDGRCRRVVIRSDRPSAAIAEFCRHNQFDLVMAPRSQEPHLLKLLTPSFRAGLLRHCDVPLWTAGSCLQTSDFTRPVRTIACLLDPDGRQAGHVPLARAFAARAGARIRFVNLIPPVDEGTLAGALPAPAVASHRGGGSAVPAYAGADTVVGTVGVALQALIENTGADLLFVGASHTARRRSLLRHLDRLPCPAVCFGRAASGFTRWTFQASTPAAHLSVASGSFHEIAS